MESVLSSQIPVHFPHLVSGAWSGKHFLEQLMRGRFKDTCLLWRVCPQSTTRTTREFESTFIEASFQFFFEWHAGSNISSTNPFVKLPSRSSGEVCVYADYQRFKTLFNVESCPDIGDWSCLFGSFAADHDVFDKLNSNLWLGTKGAHTPLHYDTYGCNLIAQLTGQKRWKLWLPKHRCIPTVRIPYEESSVYSSFDPRKCAGDGAAPEPDFEFIMNEGDVLFVPKHYWHFVTTESELALSINLWIPLQSDNADLVREAIVKFTYGSCLEAVDAAHSTLRDDSFEDSPSECVTPLYEYFGNKSFDIADLKRGWINPHELDSFTRFTGMETAIKELSGTHIQPSSSPPSAKAFTTKSSADAEAGERKCFAGGNFDPALRVTSINHAAHLASVVDSLSEAVLSASDHFIDEERRECTALFLEENPDWVIKTVINSLISPEAIDRCLGHLMRELRSQTNHIASRDSNDT